MTGKTNELKFPFKGKKFNLKLASPSHSRFQDKLNRYNIGWSL